ncbi:hypothetical protein ACI3ER_11470 [Bacillus sp. Wb]
MKHNPTGTYVIGYKYPHQQREKNETFYGQTFRGECANFNPAGNCVFVNEEGQYLIVDYRDILQMTPVKSA